LANGRVLGCFPQAIADGVNSIDGRVVLNDVAAFFRQDLLIGFPAELQFLFGRHGDDAVPAKWPFLAATRRDHGDDDKANADWHQPHPARNAVHGFKCLVFRVWRSVSESRNAADNLHQKQGNRNTRHQTPSAMLWPSMPLSLVRKTSASLR